MYLSEYSPYLKDIHGKKCANRCAVNITVCKCTKLTQNILSLLHDTVLSSRLLLIESKKHEPSRRSMLLHEIFIPDLRHRILLLNVLFHVSPNTMISATITAMRDPSIAE